MIRVKCAALALLSLSCSCLAVEPDKGSSTTIGAGEAEEALLDLFENEKKALNAYACGILSSSWAAYEDRFVPVRREMLFLLGGSEKLRRRVSLQRMSLGRIDQVGLPVRWDMRLITSEQDYRVASVSENGLPPVEVPLRERASTPSSSPFALAIAPRMAWMANLCDDSFVEKLVMKQSEFVKGSVNDRGQRVGVWAVNSKGCLMKMVFAKGSSYVPEEVSWITLINSPSVDATLKKGMLECVSKIEWEKVGGVTVPVRVSKVDNGNQKREMVEEWELVLRWKTGREAVNMLGKIQPQKADEWATPFFDNDLVPEAEELDKSEDD